MYFSVPFLSVCINPRFIFWIESTVLCGIKSKFTIKLELSYNKFYKIVINMINKLDLIVNIFGQKNDDLGFAKSKRGTLNSTREK